MVNSCGPLDPGKRNNHQHIKDDCMVGRIHSCMQHQGEKCDTRYTSSSYYRKVKTKFPFCHDCGKFFTQSQEPHRRVRQSRSSGPEMFQSQTARVGFAFLHPSTAQSMAAKTDTAKRNEKKIIAIGQTNKCWGLHECKIPSRTTGWQRGWRSSRSCTLCFLSSRLRPRLPDRTWAAEQHRKEPWFTLHCVISTILTAGRTEHSPPARSHQRSWLNLGGSIQRIPRHKHSNLKHFVLFHDLH